MDPFVFGILCAVAGALFGAIALLAIQRLSQRRHDPVPSGSILKLARPIIVPVRQNFAASADIFAIGTTSEFDGPPPELVPIDPEPYPEAASHARPPLSTDVRDDARYRGAGSLAGDTLDSSATESTLLEERDCDMQEWEESNPLSPPVRPVPLTTPLPVGATPHGTRLGPVIRGGGPGLDDYVGLEGSEGVEPDGGDFGSNHPWLE